MIQSHLSSSLSVNIMSVIVLEILQSISFSDVIPVHNILLIHKGYIQGLVEWMVLTYIVSEYLNPPVKVLRIFLLRKFLLKDNLIEGNGIFHGSACCTVMPCLAKCPIPTYTAVQRNSLTDNLSLWLKKFYGWLDLSYTGSFW